MTTKPTMQEAINVIKEMRSLSERATPASAEPGDGLNRTRWVSTSEDNRAGNQRFRIRRPDGSIGIERRPSRATKINSTSDDRELDLESDWVELVCDQHGHVFHQAMTSGSCRVMTKGRFVTDGAHQGALVKRTFYGWFPLGRCLVETLANGEIRAKSLRVPLDGATACTHGTYSATTPCAHARAEIEARRTANAAEMDALEKRFAPKNRDAEIAERAAAAAATAVAALLPTKRGK